MNPTFLIILLGLTITLAMSASPVFTTWMTAQAQNTTLSMSNDTRMVFNTQDNTITLINTTSNETISVRSITSNAGNMTINETIQNNMSLNDE